MKQEFLLSRVLYPGSFDPVTCGHLDMVSRISKMFPALTVLVTSSIHKDYWFPLSERYNMTKESLKDFKNVKVDKYEGLTTDYLKKNKIFLLIRGIRSVTDFPYERDLAYNNKNIFQEMETLFLFSRINTELVSSKWIKEIAFHKGNLKGLVPDCIEQKIRQKILQGEKT
ncbi:MAG: pantetheine-phosphate adenylyltransferase [Bdellovibrionales bacterium]|nr:pantetheine-phosphate adenylyltransferase [Bdellovibrionales bacterium]